LYPLIKEKIVDLDKIIIDSKSGVSGAGRGLSLKSHFCEVYGGFKAYNVAMHRHQPEIAEQVSFFANSSVEIIFTPHLLPIKRGILSTIYLGMRKSLEDKDVYEIYKQYYSKERFVRIFEEELPTIEGVVGSNYCDIGFKINKDTKTIIVVSVIDNLVKGASGQAIQNMNIMYGFPEETSLDNIPLYP
jgi:N-acetyl-gamma-glutamyl-phosphate reductase